MSRFESCIQTTHTYNESVAYPSEQPILYLKAGDFSFEAKNMVMQDTAQKKHPGRADFPGHLPVEEVWGEPDQSTEGLKHIGYETKKELDYQPGKMYVR